MQQIVSKWKRIGVVACMVAMPGLSHAGPIVNSENDLPPLVNGVAGPIAGNDCSGVFGQGFDNCRIPEVYDPNQSPIIVKFDDDPQSQFPVNAVITVNSLFKTVTGGEFSFSCTGDCSTGTWTYTPGAGDPLITFYVAKATANFNLFSAAIPGANGVQQGNWFTPVVTDGSAALSHLSFYDSGGPILLANGEIPEPGTLALLAAGLIGLGVVSRRRAA